MRGVFITFEGVEGSGKTTQIALLERYLMEKGAHVLTVREPGGPSTAERIREILLHSHGDMTAQAEALLFLAARAQNTAETIRPHLESGGVVVCDRYADSTIVYQGYGRGLDIETVRTLNAFATEGLEPDLTFVLDVPVIRGLARQTDRNRMEAEPVQFHERVRAGYLLEAKRNTRRMCVIDGDRRIDDVAAEVVRVLEERCRWTEGQLQMASEPS